MGESRLARVRLVLGQDFSVNSHLRPGTEKSILVPWVAAYEGGVFDTGN